LLVPKRGRLCSTAIVVEEKSKVTLFLPTNVVLQMSQPGLQVINAYEVEPHTVGGVQWGRHVVIMQFPKWKREHPKKSKGWRKHMRRQKAK
jgi:hypothetical protein